jgi:hypothetical protein
VTTRTWTQGLTSAAATAGTAVRRGTGWRIGTLRTSQVDGWWLERPEKREEVLDEDDAPDSEDTTDPPPDEDEPWSEEDDEDDGVPVIRPQPLLTLWVDANRTVRSAVAEPPAHLLADPLLAPLAVRRYERLLGYVTLLADHHRNVIAASTLAEAYDALPVSTKAAMSERADVSASQRARDRSVLVGIPAGVVPLDFFGWRGEQDHIVVYLAGHPDLMTGRVAGTGTSLSATTARALSEEGAAVTAAAVEPYVNWVRASKRFADQVTTFTARRAAWPQETEALVHQLAGALAGSAARDPQFRHRLKSGGARYVAVLRRAIVGAMP